MIIKGSAPSGELLCLSHWREIFSSSPLTASESSSRGKKEKHIMKTRNSRVYRYYCFTHIFFFFLDKIQVLLDLCISDCCLTHQSHPFQIELLCCCWLSCLLNPGRRIFFFFFSILPCQSFIAKKQTDENFAPASKLCRRPPSPPRLSQSPAFSFNFSHSHLYFFIFFSPPPTLTPPSHPSSHLPSHPSLCVTLQGKAPLTSAS